MKSALNKNSFDKEKMLSNFMERYNSVQNEKERREKEILIKEIEGELNKKGKKASK